MKITHCLTLLILSIATMCQAVSLVDNATLIPKVLPDDQVKMEGVSPDWMKTLIMAEVRMETATPEGTFAAATKILDHYAEMGVNGLWITPIWERGSKKNGYGNFGCASIEPELTGAADFEGSCAVIKRFVDEAHRRNIRVIFDIIVWGTRSDAPLVKKHPEFYRRINGDFWKVWGGYGFDWSKAELKTWYCNAAVNFILKTGADGFRVDLAPDTSGYFFKSVRDALRSRGRKIIIMSEGPNERKDTFDFEQVGVSGWTEEPDWAHPEKLREQKERFGLHNDYFLRTNIVDMIKTGKGIGKATLQQQGKGGLCRFYTSNLLNHDDSEPFAKGDRVRFAYSSLFAPFIPLWWIGEEWDNPKVFSKSEPNTGVMYFNTIDWNAIENDANRKFYEDVKRYIRIRRSHPDIFNLFPGSCREANIAKVDSKKDGAPNNLQAYARFGADKAVLIVPNYQSATPSSNFEIIPPCKAMGLPENAAYVLTDLMTGQVISKGNIAKPFTATIEAEHLGVYLLEKK